MILLHTDANLKGSFTQKWERKKKKNLDGFFACVEHKMGYLEEYKNPLWFIYTSKTNVHITVYHLFALIIWECFQEHFETICVQYHKFIYFISDL